MMTDRPGNKKMSDNEILDFIDSANEHTDKPFVTAAEIAENFDVTRQAVHARLETMYENGEVQKYIPGRSCIYWTEPYQLPKN